MNRQQIEFIDSLCGIIIIVSALKSTTIIRTIILPTH